MNWVNKLERKYRRFGIRNLTLYLIIMNAAMFILGNLWGVYEAISTFAFSWPLVLKGQIWRLVTFVFLPDTWSLLWIFFTLYIFWMIGNALANAWGSFKFTLYYLCGMLGTVLGSIISGYAGTGMYINLSVFLAFAMLYPDVEFRLFFILPVKVKYLALLSAGYEVFLIISNIVGGNWQASIAIVMSLVNFLLFFWDDFSRMIRLKKQVSRNRKRFFDEINKANNVRRFDR